MKKRQHHRLTTTGEGPAPGTKSVPLLKAKAQIGACLRLRSPGNAGAVAGFSLVEISCAVLILAVALVGMVQGISTALQSTKESELQTTAALMAAGRVEQLRAEGDLTDGNTEGDGDEALSRYHWKQSISPAGVDGLHDVQVLVLDSKSGQQIFELRTLLFEVPLESASTRSSSGRTARPERKKK